MPAKGSFGEWMPHESAPPPPPQKPVEPMKQAETVMIAAPVALALWCTVTGVITFGAAQLADTRYRPSFIYLGLFWWAANAGMVVLFGWAETSASAKIWLRRIGTLLLMLLTMMLITLLVAHCSSSSFW